MNGCCKCIHRDVCSFTEKFKLFTDAINELNKGDEVFKAEASCKHFYVSSGTREFMNPPE